MLWKIINYFRLNKLTTYIYIYLILIKHLFKTSLSINFELFNYLNFNC